MFPRCWEELFLDMGISLDQWEKQDEGMIKIRDNPVRIKYSPFKSSGYQIQGQMKEQLAVWYPHAFLVLVTPSRCASSNSSPDAQSHTESGAKWKKWLPICDCNAATSSSCIPAPQASTRLDAVSPLPPPPSYTTDPIFCVSAGLLQFRWPWAWINK